MADDLAAAARGELAGGELLGPRSPAGLPRAPSAGVQPVSLPADARFSRRRRRRVRRTLLAGLLLIVLGSGGWVLLISLPRTTGTVADVLPSETIAFVSVRLVGTADALSSPLHDLRDRLTRAVGLLPGDVLAGAGEVTALLLPGASAAEPVPALFVRGLKNLDLSAAPTLSVKAFADGNLVVRNEHLGRLRALSETRWSRDVHLRGLFRGLPQEAPILVGLRSEIVASLLRALSPHASGGASPLLLALTPDASGRTAEVRGRTSAAWRAVAGQAAAEVLPRLPAATTLAVQSASLPAALTEGNRRLPDAVSAFAQAVTADDSARDFLRQGLVAPGVVGVLPTETAGVRDTIALFRLQAGVEAAAALRRLESALLLLGPAITGTTVEGATFAEADAGGVTVRYANFGDTGRAIDYAVVEDLLLVATSKASMRALLESVRGNASLGSDAGVAVLTGEDSEGEWLFLQNDAQVRSELPPATAVLLDLFRLFLLHPTGNGVLAGTAVLSTTRSPAAPSAQPMPASTEPTAVPALEPELEPESELEPALPTEPVITDELSEPTGEATAGEVVE